MEQTREFPSDFAWGTATSAYQIEGAADVDGRSPCIWDVFARRQPCPIKDGSNGDVACDSYHHYEDDVALLKSLKLTYYRFSLSWSRLLPDGTTSVVNELGVQYYKRLIKALLDNGIKPMVSLLHFDHPQALEDTGGWLHEEMVDHFAQYARFCFQQFGNEVKHWLTINEPLVTSLIGYGTGEHAPGHSESPGTYVYLAGHNMIKAHAKAYRIYDQEFRSKQNGIIGPCLNFTYGEAASDKQEDIEAAERHNAFNMGWFAHPIFVNGDYPEIMKKAVAAKSELQGRCKSRLPEFTSEEQQMIKGSHDFLGLNYYTSSLIKSVPSWHELCTFDADQDRHAYQPASWKRYASFWQAGAPWNFRNVLRYVRDNYGNPEIWITENGCGTTTPSLKDDERIEYIGKHLAAVNDSIREDEIPVKGYMLWSLLDNFEWAAGYTEFFGICAVDSTEPEHRRTPKESAKFYSKIAETNKLVGAFSYERPKDPCSVL